MKIEKLENEIQSWVAVQSEHSCQIAGDAFVVCANDLAEFIKDLFEKEKEKLKGCVVVPVEPTDLMINAYRDNSVSPVSTLSIVGYKAMIEAARGGK